jgi:hypothetical protein
MDTAETEVFPALTGNLHPGHKLGGCARLSRRLITATGAETQREAARPGQPPGTR